MARIDIIPRLLSRDQAAAYCGFSRVAFERHCPVVPMGFGDERLLRWDRHDLDAWIENRKNPAHSPRNRVPTPADMSRDLERF